MLMYFKFPLNDVKAFMSINEEWPFELFCESLTYDLFSTHWEVRHGAAIGLREVLRQHAGGAGRTPGMDTAQQEGATQRYLEDIALRTTCVLALDKFGDFVSDEVVAPVRESCAQALGIVLSVMREDAVVSVMNILITLLRQEQWEARHGALLGLKYLLAVRKELTAKLLPEVFPSVFAGLQDSCDDVSAVSAAALAPVADDIVNFLPDQVTSLITCLWDLLLDLDDLTAATNSMMSLLSSLLANSHVSYTHRGAELHELVPRLWPFLGHSIKSVRRSALATLQTLVAMENTEPPVNVWLPQVLQEALRTLFQRCIVESNQETQ
ncbi:PREDICTED: TATA-binding protein-associated factor 172-like, partial [Priapulus caudatus]|uniref:TATA-binding protein-associated factor 172-like n=1 Tax=Priapulus caudatus TaxID=37621 RepID=A0ABM1EHF9_PRICU